MIADPDADRVTGPAAEVRSINGNLLAAFQGRLLRGPVIDNSPQVDHGWLEMGERVLCQLHRSRRHGNQHSARGNRWNHGYRGDPDLSHPQQQQHNRNQRDGASQPRVPGRAESQRHMPRPR